MNQKAKRLLYIPGPQDVLPVVPLALFVVVVTCVALLMRLWCYYVARSHRWYVAHRDYYGKPEYRCKCCGTEK
tara:strand:+ start:9573 stop:9791 length:219 start_codon:yes stop_codon:yes gene_type:complete